MVYLLIGTSVRDGSSQTMAGGPRGRWEEKSAEAIGRSKPLTAIPMATTRSHPMNTSVGGGKVVALMWIAAQTGH